jgi:ATP-dependent DNA ligase
MVIFDLPHLRHPSTADLRYRERRENLEGLFADQGLAPLWTLCPASNDPADVPAWIEA